MKILTVVLLVKHLTVDGVWFEAPPSDMGTMWECKIAKKEVEEGFREDAVPDKNFEVRCEQVWGVEPPTSAKGNS